MSLPLPSLSTGVIDSFFSSNANQGLPRDSVLQILRIKPMSTISNSTNATNATSSSIEKSMDNGSKRWRLIVSDGVHSMNCLVGLPLNHAVESGTLKPFSIFKVDACTQAVVQNRKVPVLLGIVLMGEAQEMIGNPVAYQQPSTSTSTSASTTPTTFTTALGTSANPPPRVNPTTATTSSASSNLLSSPKTPTASSFQSSTYSTSFPSHPPPSSSSSSISSSTLPTMTTTTSSTHAPPIPLDGPIVPIASLSPYSTKWTLQVRLMNKSEIKYWNNARGEGKLFHFVLMDQSGDIKVTGFNATVDQFYSQLIEHQVYYVSGCKVKLAQKEYNVTSSEYELTLDEHTTQIIPCPASSLSTSMVPSIHLSPTLIAQLNETELNSLVDIVGILLDVQPCTTLTSKTTKKELIKRDVALVDTSGYQIKLTMWGKSAEQQYEVGHVLACKHVKLLDYQGRSLSALQSSSLLMDPDIPSAHRLLGWYQHHQLDTFPSMTSSSTSSSSSSLSSSSSMMMGSSTLPSGSLMNTGSIPFISIAELIEHADHYKDQAVYIDATIVFIRDTPLMYAGCPQCNKKLIDEYCEKCQTQVSEPCHRYIVSMSVADASSQVWLTLFNETAERVFLNTPASKLAKTTASMDSDTMRLSIPSLIQHTQFQSCIFKLKSKLERYQDEARWKYNVLDVMPYMVPSSSSSPSTSSSPSPLNGTAVAGMYHDAAVRARDKIRKLTGERAI